MEKKCNVEGCDRIGKARGWCKTHYMRWWSSGQEPTTPVAPPRRAQPVPCAREGCTRSARHDEWCEPHYRRVLRNGDPGPAEIKPKAANGQGRGRYVSNGYVFLRGHADHPNAYANGVIMEHTLFMSQRLDRPLTSGENVHHKNGKRDDNRPENLELWVSSQPKGQRVQDLLAWADEIRARYGDLDLTLFD